MTTPLLLPPLMPPPPPPLPLQPLLLPPPPPPSPPPPLPLLLRGGGGGGGGAADILKTSVMRVKLSVAPRRWATPRYVGLPITREKDSVQSDDTVVSTKKRPNWEIL